MPFNRENQKMLKRQAAKMAFFFMVAIVAFMPLHALGQNAPDQKAVVEKAQLTLESFMEDESMSWFHEHIKDARGMVIVPQLIKGAFFIGGSGGSGVLIAHDEKTDEWSYPAFVTLGGASFGFQFGGQASEVILLVMTQKGIDSMISTTVKLGGDASVAVGPIGRGMEGSTAPNLSADLLSFSRAKGLFGGVSLEGAVVAARDAWNTAYYGKPTKATDILVRRDVSNPPCGELAKGGECHKAKIGSCQLNPDWASYTGRVGNLASDNPMDSIGCHGWNVRYVDNTV